MKEDSQSVYLSIKSGKKYHYIKSCLKTSDKDDIKEITINDAKKIGYKLCNVCKNNYKNISKFNFIRKNSDQNSENRLNIYKKKMDSNINSEDADDTIFNNISKIEEINDYKENEDKGRYNYKEINEKHKDENKKEVEEKSKPIINYSINFNIDPSRLENKKEAEDVYEKIKIIRGEKKRIIMKII